MKLLMAIEYNGKNFSGWQTQVKKRSVQEEVETALKILFCTKIQIHGSGRTDSGVHALNQTAHFEIKDELLKTFFVNSELKKDRLIMAVNAHLPEDIKVLNLKKVANTFHARYAVKEKVYLYKLQTKTNKPSPLCVGLIGTCKQDLDIEKMREGANFLIGEHDFTSFCSSKTQVTNFIRTINYIKIKKEKNLVTFEISGNGFLYNMVRIIVGTLVDIGIYKIEPEKIKEILTSKNRSSAGKTVQPEGLYLKNVKY